MDAVSTDVASAAIPVGQWVADEERALLEGPHSRLKELRLVLRVAWEFIAGFRTLHFVGPCVTVFGSARFGDSHPYYALGREVGRGRARLGFTVMTGGGPGLMEAANRGARDAGGRSVGCNIELPQEQAPTPSSTGRCCVGTSSSAKCCSSSIPMRSLVCPVGWAHSTS